MSVALATPFSPTSVPFLGHSPTVQPTGGNMKDEEDELWNGARVLAFLKENSSNENSSVDSLDAEGGSEVADAEEFRPDMAGENGNDEDSESEYEMRHMAKRGRKNFDADQSSLESGTSRHDGSQAIKRKKRGKLPDSAIKMLKMWLFDHSSHPYPSEGEKAQMIDETGLSLIQINNWFSNARRRLLRKDA